MSNFFLLGQISSLNIHLSLSKLVLFFSYYLISSCKSTADEIMGKVQHQFHVVKMDCNTRNLWNKRLHTWESLLIWSLFLRDSSTAQHLHSKHELSYSFLIFFSICYKFRPSVFLTLFPYFSLWYSIVTCKARHRKRGCSSFLSLMFMSTRKQDYY